MSDLKPVYTCEDDPRQRIVFFDLETTIPVRKADPVELLEFAAVVVLAEGFQEIHYYQTLLKPRETSLISHRSIECNGITKADVENAPDFEEVSERIHHLLNGHVWAGHNISQFDNIKLRQAFERIGKSPPTPSGIVDTLPLLKARYGPRAGNMKMSSLAKYCGLGHQVHRSLEDVRMNMDVLKQCATTLLLESAFPDLFQPPLPATPEPAPIRIASANEAPPPGSPQAPMPRGSKSEEKREKEKQKQRRSLPANTILAGEEVPLSSHSSFPAPLPKEEPEVPLLGKEEFVGFSQRNPLKEVAELARTLSLPSDSSSDSPTAGRGNGTSPGPPSPFPTLLSPHPTTDKNLPQNIPKSTEPYLPSASKVEPEEEKEGREKRSSHQNKESTGSPPTDIEELGTVPVNGAPSPPTVSVPQNGDPVTTKPREPKQGGRTQAGTPGPGASGGGGGGGILGWLLPSPSSLWGASEQDETLSGTDEEQEVGPAHQQQEDEYQGEYDDQYDESEGGSATWFLDELEEDLVARLSRLWTAGGAALVGGGGSPRERGLGEGRSPRVLPQVPPAPEVTYAGLEAVLAGRAGSSSSPRCSEQTAVVSRKAEGKPQHSRGEAVASGGARESGVGEGSAGYSGQVSVVSSVGGSGGEREEEDWGGRMGREMGRSGAVRGGSEVGLRGGSGMEQGENGTEKVTENETEAQSRSEDAAPGRAAQTGPQTETGSATGAGTEMNEQTADKTRGKMTKAPKETRLVAPRQVSRKVPEGVEARDLDFSRLSASVEGGTGGFGRVSILYSGNPLVVRDSWARIRSSVSDKFSFDDNGRPRFNILIEPSQSTVKLLQACDDLLQNEAMAMGDSSSQYRSTVIEEKMELPTIRLKIATSGSRRTVASYRTRFLKRSGPSWRHLFEEFKPSSVDPINFRKAIPDGCFIDVTFSVETYEFGGHRGLRLVALLIVLQ